MRNPAGRRYFLLGGALFIVGCIGCIHIYWQGVDTGTLSLGSRTPQLITLAESPERFQFWLNATLVTAVLFAALGLASLWVAFHRNNDGP